MCTLQVYILVCNLKVIIHVRANAIMGIKYDYENIGNGMLMVGVTGTAVRISSEGT